MQSTVQGRSRRRGICCSEVGFHKQLNIYYGNCLLAEGLVEPYHLGLEGGGVEGFADGGVEGTAMAGVNDSSIGCS